ncbi:MAG: hypothetical protein AAF567_03350 [Actinomycetota bacterium]
MHRALALVLALSLVATACAGSVTVDETVGSARQPTSEPAAADDASGSASPSTDGAGVDPGVAPSNATIADETAAPTASPFSDWVDPGPGLPPSQRCGIDPPLTIGRIGLALDIAVAAPAAYLDTSELSEVLPDSPSTVEKGLLCLVVHEDDAGSISCGVERIGDTLHPVRHEPLVVTMVWFLAEATDAPVAMPVQKIYEDCDVDFQFDPLDVDAPTGEAIVRSPMITADFLSAPFDTGARYYVDQGADEGMYGDNQCASIAVAADRHDAIGDALLATWDIDRLWDPVPAGHVPTLEAFTSLNVVIDAATTPNAQVINASEDVTSTLALAAGLSNWAYARIGELAIEHDQQDDPRFGAHIAWQLGGMASSGLDPYETATFLRSIAANRCTESQTTAATSPGDTATEGSTCALLADVYEARDRFRQAIHVPPEDRRNLDTYLNPVDPYGYGDANEALFADPLLSREALSGLYYAESGLVYLIDYASPLDPAEVRGYEAQAEVLHAFTRENCPSIENVDLPSILEIAPQPDPEDVARARTIYCSSLDRFLTTRHEFRATIDSGEGLQPLDASTIERMEVMRAATATLVELFDESAPLLLFNGERVGSGGGFEYLYAIERDVRLANFGSVAIPIDVHEDEDGTEVPSPHVELAAEYCPNVDPALFNTPVNRANLPGPKYTNLGWPADPADLCPATERALTARHGFRLRVDDHLAGDETAAADATDFAERFEHFGWELVDRIDASALGVEASGAFEAIERMLHSALTDDWSSREYFVEALAERTELLGALSAACPGLASSLSDTADVDLELFDELTAAHLPEELPTVMTVNTTCAYLDRIFTNRVAHRTAIEADDRDGANTARDGLYDYSQWDVDQWPAGLNQYWLGSVRDVEGALFSRAFSESPIAPSEAASEDNVAELESWVGENCADVEVQPVQSILDVFPPPDPQLVAEAQATYCAAAHDLFEKRADFRATIATASGDQAHTASFAEVALAAQVVGDLWADQLLLNPDGQGGYGAAGRRLLEREALIFQATLADDPLALPHLQRDQTEDSRGDEIVGFVEATCDEPIDDSLHPIESLQSLIDRLALPMLPDPDAASASTKTVYCRQLEVAQLALAHALRTLGYGEDPVVARTFLERYGRIDFYGITSDVFTDDDRNALPEGTVLTPFAWKVVDILVRGIEGEPRFDDGWDLDDAIDDAPSFAPIVAETCPDVPPALLDFDLEAARVFYETRFGEA